MRRVAVDTETHLIKAGQLAPRLVVLSWAERVGGAMTSGLVDAAGAPSFFAGLLDDPEVVVVGANLPFDLCVLCAERADLLPKVFAALDDDRASDVQVRQKLIDVAKGELEFRRTTPIGGGPPRPERTTHSLATLARLWLGRHLEKEDTWRLRYAELLDVPLDAWPPDARSYALTDATTTLEVDEAQLDWAAEAFESRAGRKDGVVPDEAPQVRAAWALHLMATWGVRTDGPAVRKLRERLEREQRELRERLIPTGLVRPDGTRDMAKIRGRVTRAFKMRQAAEEIARERPEAWAAMVEAREGDEGEAVTLLSPVFEEEVLAKISDDVVPKTPGGQVATSEEVLRESADADLVLLAGGSKGAKVLSTYVPALERGVDRPLTSRPNVLVASGRTSWGDPNLQNPPRGGDVRGCFVPRPGTVFAFCDYSTIELRALAQVCLDLLGYSKMAEALNEGKDLHAELAATLLGRSSEEVLAAIAAGDKEVERARQLSKGINFACPGGLGAARLVDYLKASGIILSPDRYEAERKARELIDAWKKTWQETVPYFDYISQLVGSSGSGTVVQLRSGRVRGECNFTAACNTLFQGLTSELAKEALYVVSRASYVERTSPLFGSRPVLFLHDEIALEVPEARASEAADELARLMIAAGKRWIPDVAIAAEPVLVRRWLKGAKPLRVDGRLVPVRARKEDRGGKSFVTWEADL